jgi:hypothetical protein
MGRPIPKRRAEREGCAGRAGPDGKALWIDSQFASMGADVIDRRVDVLCSASQIRKPVGGAVIRGHRNQPGGCDKLGPLAS